MHYAFVFSLLPLECLYCGSSIVDKSKNRGFAFVDYDSHRSASKARRKLIPDRVLLWGKEIAVDWAQPESEVDNEIMSKVGFIFLNHL
jgi:RNA recognition motif-containing protein